MDLNLYPVFVEIMRHGSVSRAAEQLGLTQPATSNALSRLRSQLGDPLFVRTRNGMLPTHFAVAIRSRIEQGLEVLRDVSAGVPKDLPALEAINRHFRIVMSDLGETLFLPDLVGLLAGKAPGVSIEIIPFQREMVLEHLEKGHADFALAHIPAGLKNVTTRPLSQQTFVCVMRRGHPGFKGTLSLSDYVSHGHILVSPNRGGMRGVVDKQLKKLGKRRSVVCSVPHFLSACQLASRSDHLLTIPRLLAEKVGASFGLDTYELPFELPGFMIDLHWHQSRDSDPELTSLRTFMLAELGSQADAS